MTAVIRDGFTLTVNDTKTGSDVYIPLRAHTPGRTGSSRYVGTMETDIRGGFQTLTLVDADYFGMTVHPIPLEIKGDSKQLIHHLPNFRAGVNAVLRVFPALPGRGAINRIELDLNTEIPTHTSARTRTQGTRLGGGSIRSRQDIREARARAVTRR